MKYRPYEYQKTAMQWILDHQRCGLFLDMGLGKTVSTLTAIQQLMDDCEVSRTLVVAPKKVAETTWTTEVENSYGYQWAQIEQPYKSHFLREFKPQPY